MNGRTALVTGAGKGIGRAVALRLAGMGFQVAVNYRSSEKAALEVCDIIAAEGGTAFLAGGDVSDPEGVKQVFSLVAERAGPVSVLVNNAGITRDGLLLRMKDDDWSSVLTANLSSVFLCTREAVRGMVRAKWGRVINIASVVGIIGNPGQANYCASKAGVIGFTKSVAREYASKGITANAVAPGFIGTDMTLALPAEAREALLKQVPAGRPGAPEDVAGVVGFLASEEASYITGQVIAVDGGMTMC
ncbi:MAG: 3-oxoacyl-(acyl-carrier-protein) reductase FabG [Synergistetes bacterium ADurb.BinA166]|jgi:3-oxoacyl-[acyl-carrier protein] reductase|nr:MAG: 3-oxoacyl-(acyl-carrier-protein) reductase FabG [Synergistetes bacterium ADurb.BinA166]